MQRAGYALGEAIKAEKTTYGDTFHPAYKLLPSACATYADYFASVHDLVKEFGRIKVEVDEEYLVAGEGREARHPGGIDRKTAATPIADDPKGPSLPHPTLCQSPTTSRPMEGSRGEHSTDS